MGLSSVRSSEPKPGTVQDIHTYGTPFKYSVEKEGRDRKLRRPFEIQALTACLDNLCRDQKTKNKTNHQKTKLSIVCKELFDSLRELPYLLLC